MMPGPCAPKGEGYWSFLTPLLDELDLLSKGGMEVVCDDGQTRKAKVHLLLATGDIPGVATLASHSGHMSNYGCRICPIKGVHGDNRYGEYFVPNSANLSLRWWPNEVFRNGSLETITGGKKASDRVDLQMIF